MEKLKTKAEHLQAVAHELAAKAAPFERASLREADRLMESRENETEGDEGTQISDSTTGPLLPALLAAISATISDIKPLTHFFILDHSERFFT